MRRFGSWAGLVLILAACTACGCAAKEPEKAAAKSGAAPAQAGAAAPSSGTQASGPQAAPPSSGKPEATPVTSGDSEKVVAVAAPMDKATPKTPEPAPKVPAPVPMVKSAPAPAATVKNTPATTKVVAGPAPVATKIDPAVQKRVNVLGEKLKAKAEKKGADGLGVNDFKQIGLAFHIYHDAHHHFPAANGSGTKDEPHPGLSWRVHLLPYIEQAALYDEFKKDEAWDSEHNKALIAKMPKIFGTNAEGKTRVHVLTGNGAPFKNDEGGRIQDIIDGTSNTIMCLEAGADKAEIWTKPGGLEFDPKEPLKCIGNVGEKFIVGMMDGSVRKVAKSINPETFALIVQYADSMPVGEFAETENDRRKSAKKIDIAASVTPLGAPSARLDLSYFPADAFAAMVVHPRRIYEHSVVKAVREMLPAEMFVPRYQRRGSQFYDPTGMTELNEELGQLGISLYQIDEIVVMIDKSWPDAAAAGFQEGVPQFGAIIRNSAPVNVEAVFDELTTRAPSCEVQEHDGVALLVNVNEKVAIGCITDSMFIVGETEFVKKMISARESNAATSALTKHLDAAGNRMFVAGIDAVAVQETIKQQSELLPPPFSLFSAYIVGAKEVGLTIDLDAPELLQAKLQFKTPELATGLFGVLDQQFTEAKKNYGMLKEMLASDPSSAAFQPYADQIVADAKLANEGDLITFTVPKLKDFEKLPAALKPAVEKARKAAEQSRQLNSLKLIGLAFHNYHDVNTKFPALNGPADKDQPHPGLSWRVYLLPYLEEAALYNEFKLDEPWDSEHNKKLIARMPKIYGDNAEGKTTMHVFTGKGAPFQDGVGVGISAITDGTSNTFLTVEAGPDVAEIWTKPGGLVFDVENPLKCLGAIKEFSVVLMDGSARRIKDIDADVFSKLVQHQDGEPVQIPE